MRAEHEQLKFFLIFPHNYQKKDSNKADVILIASFTGNLQNGGLIITNLVKSDTFKCEKIVWKLIYRLK